MLHFAPWKIGLIALALIWGALAAAPNLVQEDARTAIPGFLPSSAINLGLDLQGGSYLLLEVDTDGVIAERLQGYMEDVRVAMRGQRGGPERIAVSGLRLVDDEIGFVVSDSAQVDDALSRARELSSPIGGVFGAGGFTLAVRKDGERIVLRMTDDANDYERRQAVSQSLEVVRRRIDELGTREPTIQRQGQNRIVVQVPGEDDPDRLKDLLKRTAKISFHDVDTSVSVEEALQGRVPPRSKLLPNVDRGGFILVKERPVITGDMLRGATHSLAQDSGGWQVNFVFDNRGGRIFAKYTAENVGRPFAIVLDEEVISAPEIQGVIPGGSGRITGNYTVESASDLALLLRAGALPADLTIEEQRTVGPDLGADSVAAGRTALIVGFAGVIVFMLLVYGLFGLFANIALIANVVLIAGALSALQATLTLPGIAGIVLTIGMAVDANVLIFERIREELRAGKSPLSAVESGYRFAQSAILDANITTFVAAAILFQLGSGPVRGFAITLAIGVVTSVFTAFTLTRFMVASYLTRTRPKTLAV
ncbi:MAG: protein translocase subunit SecD [Pseudomonadota bacterium]